MQKLYSYTFLKRDKTGHFWQNWIISVEQEGFILWGIKSIKLKNELYLLKSFIYALEQELQENYLNTKLYISNRCHVSLMCYETDILGRYSNTRHAQYVDVQI